jgi:murein DD-endopeptidase MepM/ murein hydrolase activator NlpD
MISASLLLLILAHPAMAAEPARLEPTLTVETRAFRPGELLLITVAGHDAKSAPEARLNGRSLSLFPGASTGTWLAFAGLDLDIATGTIVLDAVLRPPGGEPTRRSETFIVEPGAFTSVEITVEQKFVTPAKNDAERAESESAKLHKIFTRTEEKRLFEGRFDSPIPGAATARFGERRVFNGQPRAPHSGMDLKARLGAPVRAPAAGRVLLADSLFFAGKSIILDHGWGLTTQYSHLSKYLVKPGDIVKKGRIIGHVGATGRVTGPHLHWSLKFRDARIDPYSLVHLDLDAKLRPRSEDPLARSLACGKTDLPPAPRWGRPSLGLRARARPLKPSYAVGENVSLLVEIQNVGQNAAFVDFVRDSGMRPLVLGVGEPPRPYESLASSNTASGALTEQVKIAKGRILCFEQNQSASGPLLANATTAYALIYATEQLYPSTATVRSGLWRGRLAIPSATVVVSAEKL